jgi:hypothetical protein
MCRIARLFLEDRRISAKSIAEQLSISRECVGSVVHEDMDMRKLSAKWVQKCLNADLTLQRCHSSEKIMEFFLRDSNNFLSRLVTMGETWLYYHDPATKEQSMDWRYSGLTHLAPKNSECKIPLEKFSPRCFGITTASSSLIIF